MNFAHLFIDLFGVTSRAMVDKPLLVVSTLLILVIPLLFVGLILTAALAMISVYSYVLYQDQSAILSGILFGTMTLLLSGSLWVLLRWAKD